MADNTCKHCRQVTFDGLCECPAAQRERDRDNMIKNAKAAINELFGLNCMEDHEAAPVPDEVLKILNDTVEPIANYQMFGISMTLPNGTKASIAIGGKGVIKVKRTESSQMVLEVSE